jgi:hypothetical protein
LPRQQLVHLQLCIIYITNIIHKKIISSINELASENFAWSVKHLWKSLKKSQALSEAKHLALGAQGKLREESRSPPGGLKAKEQSEIPRCARNDIS